MYGSDLLASQCTCSHCQALRLAPQISPRRPICDVRRRVRCSRPGPPLRLQSPWPAREWCTFPAAVKSHNYHLSDAPDIKSTWLQFIAVILNVSGFGCTQRQTQPNDLHTPRPLTSLLKPNINDRRERPRPRQLCRQTAPLPPKCLLVTKHAASLQHHSKRERRSKKKSSGLHRGFREARFSNWDRGCLLVVVQTDSGHDDKFVLRSCAPCMR